MRDIVRRIWKALRRISMKIESRAEWKRVRERGHGHWILWQGVLGFGLPLVVVTLLTLYLMGSFPGEIDGAWWVKNLIFLLMASAAGYIVADIEWHRAEGRFGHG